MNRYPETKVDAYERYIKGSGPHSRLGIFYRGVLGRIKSEIREVEGNWNEFLDGLAKGAVKLIELPQDQKEVFYKLATRNFFPLLRSLAEDVALKGTSLPYGVETPRYYGSTVVDKGESGNEWFSMSIHTNAIPEALRVNDTEVSVLSRVFVSTATSGVSFYLLADGRTAFGNDNKDDTERLLDSVESLFDVVPSHKLYPIGNPASWIGLMLEHKLSDRMEQQLLSSLN